MYSERQSVNTDSTHDSTEEGPVDICQAYSSGSIKDVRVHQRCLYYKHTYGVAVRSCFDKWEFLGSSWCLGPLIRGRINPRDPV